MRRSTATIEVSIHAQLGEGMEELGDLEKREIK